MLNSAKLKKMFLDFSLDPNTPKIKLVFLVKSLHQKCDHKWMVALNTMKQKNAQSKCKQLLQWRFHANGKT